MQPPLDQSNPQDFDQEAYDVQKFTRGPPCRVSSWVDKVGNSWFAIASTAAKRTHQHFLISCPGNWARHISPRRVRHPDARQPLALDPTVVTPADLSPLIRRYFIILNILGYSASMSLSLCKKKIWQMWSNSCREKWIIWLCSLWWFCLLHQLKQPQY